MAYRRTIEVNPFSSKSINSAIMSLRREKKRLQEDFRREFLEELGKEIEGFVDWQLSATARERNEECYCEHTVEGNTVIIRAYGENVIFVEFGAGVYADNGEYQQLGFEPGVWSEWHYQTYQAWVAAGMPGEYRSNQVAAHSFDNIINDLDTHINNAAYTAYKKVYGL